MSGSGGSATVNSSSATSRASLRILIATAGLSFEDCVTTHALRQRAADAVLLGNEPADVLRRLAQSDDESLSYEDLTSLAAQRLREAPPEDEVAIAPLCTIDPRTVDPRHSLLIDVEAAERRAAGGKRNTWWAWFQRHPLTLLVLLQLVVGGAATAVVVAGASEEEEVHMVPSPSLPTPLTGSQVAAAHAHARGGATGGAHASLASAAPQRAPHG